MTHWHCLLCFTTAACVSAIATAATHDSAATATHDVSKACIHVDETAPPCANDATLFAFVGSAKGSKFVQKDNCATCVCGRDGEDEQEPELDIKPEEIKAATAPTELQKRV